MSDKVKTTTGTVYPGFEQTMVYGCATPEGTGDPWWPPAPVVPFVLPDVQVPLGWKCLDCGRVWAPAFMGPCSCGEERGER